MAEQRAKTAEAEAKANEILAAWVCNDPKFLSASAWTPRVSAHQPAGLLAEHHSGAHPAR